MEKFPIFEHKESDESLGEKHNEWLKEARVVLEGIGLHVIVGISAFYILRSLGVDLPPHIMAALPTTSTLGYMAKRRKDLNQQK